MALRHLFAVAAVAALIAGSAAAQNAPAEPVAPAAATPSGFANIVPKGDVVQTLQASGQFQTLLKILDMTNVTAVLKRPQPAIAIFAPTDAAFAAMPAGELSDLMAPANASKLQARVLSMIYNGPLDYAKLNGKRGPIASAGGGQIFVDGSVTPNKVNDANMLQADVKAANGTIFVIDKVIGPGFTAPAEPAAQ